MTTWVDGRGLQSGFKEHAGRGIGTYVASLAQALDERAAEDEVRFFVEKGAELIAPVPLQRRVLVPSVPGGVGRFATLLRQHTTLSLWLARRHPAAVHFAAQTDAPAFCAVPTIVTVHDVVLHRHGEWYEGSGEGASVAFALAAQAESPSPRVAAAGTDFFGAAASRPRLLAPPAPLPQSAALRSAVLAEVANETGGAALDDALLDELAASLTI